MDENFQRGVMENVDVTAAVQQIQEIIEGELIKINPGVLRGIEGGTLHFILNQEFIDHTLLNPEYITAHLQNGLVLDINSFLPQIQNPAVFERQYVNEIEIPGDIQVQHENGVVGDHDRKVAQAFLQCVQKHGQISQVLPNETQVIVSNKEMATLTPLSETEKHNIQVTNNFIPIDDQSFPMLPTHDNNSMKKLYPTLQNNTNNTNEEALPPLTKIKKIQAIKYIQDISSTVTNTSQLHFMKQETELDVKDDNGELHEETESDTDSLPSVPSLVKTNLPHKKRISTKLKSIANTEPVQKDSIDYDIHTVTECIITNNGADLSPQYTCELCTVKCESQLEFFIHLKSHYEPSLASIKTEARNNNLVNETNLHHENTDSITMSDALNIEHLNSDELNQHNELNRSNEYESVIEEDKGSTIGDDFPEENVTDRNEDLKHRENEFSDTEDMLEGIRGVVDKVQESVDNDLNMDGGNGINKDWYSNDIPGNIVFHSSAQNNMPQITSSNDDNVVIYFSQKDACENNWKNGECESILRKELLKVKPTENETKIKYVAATSVVIKPVLNLREMELQYTEENNEESDNELNDNKTSDIKTNDNKAKNKRKRKTYKCKGCDKVCNSKNSLHYHFLSHTGERPHQCEVCGKSFFAASALKVHKRLHSGDKPYNCNFCSRAFRQWGDLKYHITSLHTEEKNHQCEFCGKDFARRYSLVIHRRIHTGEKNYKCEYCDKTFRASSYLQDHRKIHTGEKPHACGVCGKKFRVRGDLKRHLNIHTRANSAKGKKAFSSAVIKKTVLKTDITDKRSTLPLQKGDNPTEDFIYRDDHIDIFRKPLTDLTENIDEINVNSKISASTTEETTGNLVICENTKKRSKRKSKKQKLPILQNNLVVNAALRAKILTSNDNEIFAENLSKTASKCEENTSILAVDMSKVPESDRIIMSSTSVGGGDDIAAGNQQFIVWPLNMPYMS